MPVVSGAGRFAPPPAGEAGRFDEHLQTGDLSLGTYSLPVGAVDDQSPHTEDEIYVVTAGRAHFVDADGRVPIGPGDTIFVAAGAEHRFVDITEDLVLVVVFAPPYRSRSPRD
jgi:mannose-6-phosphate isomerase-like protein (cupin superfamily)